MIFLLALWRKKIVIIKKIPMSDLNEKKYYEQNEIFTEQVKAGKRTYYFDMKETKKGDRYLVITERNRRYKEDGSFRVEKQKVFLFEEDFENFKQALNNASAFFNSTEKREDKYTNKDVNDSNEEEIEYYQPPEMLRKKKKKEEPSDEDIKDSSYFTDINFDDIYD